MSSASDLLNREGALLIATALEVALFGKSSGPKSKIEDKLDRIELCGGAKKDKNRKPISVAQRLELLLTAAVALPPIIEFNPDTDPTKTLFLAFFPFTVVGIYETKAEALESLRPFVQAHNSARTPPILPKPDASRFGFQPPMAVEAVLATGALPNYVEAACMAMIFPKYRKPLTAEEEAAEPAVGPSYYVSRLPKSMPRQPGRDYQELMVAAEKQDETKAMVLMRLTWGPKKTTPPPPAAEAAAKASGSGEGGSAAPAAPPPEVD